MTEDDRTGYSSAATSERVASVLSPIAPPRARGGAACSALASASRRIRWLRLLAIFVPLAFLALISFVFGVVLAFEPQLGPLTNKLKATYSTGPQLGDPGGAARLPRDRDPDRPQPVLPDPNATSRSMMDHAIVAIEDKRFWTESGVDIRGIARAFLADVFHTGSGTQGASTITEQFVKNALSRRGPPHDLREAQGGGARLPAQPSVAEEEDPRRVPEHRLLRQRRPRDRGGGARLLRQRPRCRTCTAAASSQI